MQLKTVLKAGVVMLVAFFAIESIRTSYSPQHASAPALATQAAPRGARAVSKLPQMPTFRMPVIPRCRSSSPG